MHNKITEEILDHFKICLSNLKNTTEAFMIKSGIRAKMGASWTTYDILLYKVTEIIHFPMGKEKWVDFWGIIKEPIKIKDLTFVTGRGRKATIADLKKLEKMKYIQTRLLPYGKIIYVRVFPEYAHLVYRELPDFDKLCKKFKYYKKTGQEKEAQEVWSEIEKNLERVASEKETPKAKNKTYKEKKLKEYGMEDKEEISPEEVKQRMNELRKKLGLKEKQ